MTSHWNALSPELEEGDDWFAAQERQIADQYGGYYIQVIYNEQGLVVYYCELCFCEMNGKPSLDSHCTGMKHLKKKSQFEVGHGSGFSSSRGRGIWNNEQRSQGQNIMTRPGTSQMPPPPPQIDYNSSRNGQQFDYNSSRNGQRFDYDHSSSKSSGRNSNRWSQNERNDRKRSRSPTHHQERPVSPPVATIKLASSGAGNLLKQLADCCVKDENDSDLAVNVVNTLTKTLIKYQKNIGKGRIAELLHEAEMKFSMVKAFKLGTSSSEKYSPPPKIRSNLNTVYYGKREYY